jgi:predicted nucleic-acid-binding Zn-ribbon protein
MRNGQCVKCQSKNIYVAVSGAGFDEEILLQTQVDKMIPTRQWITYLCADCGYFENYVTDKAKIAEIVADPAKSGWRKLSS